MARTIRTKIYRFDELDQPAKDRAINNRINEMIEFESEYYYHNWPKFKKAVDMAERMQTPWFAGSYVWDYCKDDILEQLQDQELYEFTKDGKQF